MSAAELLITRLDRVQQSGKGWRALCPKCGGRGRKLSVVESEDGRLLLHCFAGCSAGEVVQALGLGLVDLFPERLPDDNPENRRQRRRAAREAQWGAALDVLDFESTVVAFAAADLCLGKTLPPEDMARLLIARQRIDEARQVLRDPKPWRPAQVGGA